MTAAALMTSARTGTGKDDWRTPECVLERVRMVGPIALDPCASTDPDGLIGEGNLDETDDGLCSDWLVGAESGAPFPSALVYYGDRPWAFEAALCDVARVVRL